MLLLLRLSLIVIVLPAAGVRSRFGSHEVRFGKAAAPAPAPPAESSLNFTINSSMVEYTPAYVNTSTSNATAAPYSDNSTKEVPMVQPLQDATPPSELEDVDCEMGEWSDWGDCADIQHDGLRSKFQFRDRIAIIPQMGNGSSCNETSNQRTCIGAKSLLR
mmetsp:Transcript_64669/g.171200  ORF Transcript_64669/g.171200 Transcript_64669/m.171200 type:complete len:161 (-) Transcript_64669:256-738(-)